MIEGQSKATKVGGQMNLEGGYGYKVCVSRIYK